VLMLFQKVCAAIVQNKVVTAAARVEAVALLEGGPLNNFEPGIYLTPGGRNPCV